jgi:diguanylate cyclase (GGDEF)-like protein
MRRRYVVALAILGVYFVASYLILHQAIANQRSMARAITTSGQQRMYSQRIAMFAEAILARPDPAARERARMDLDTSIRKFTQAHQALISGDSAINPSGWPPPSVRQMYFEQPFVVDQQVKEYLAHARSLQARAQADIRAGDADLEYLVSVGPGPLLMSLDAVVAQYNRVQVTSIQTFELLQFGLLLIGLTTLVIVWFTIFVPMEREIAAKTAALVLGATLDPLTHLLNRSAFAERVVTVLANVKRRGESGAMLMIDLDHFKMINDSFGHLVGDRALIETANRLRESVRAGEYITRLGGDEFAVFAPAIDRDGSLETFVARMCDALRFDLDIDGLPHHVSASIGVARYPCDGLSLDQLLAYSDHALYAAKAAGRGTFRYYSRIEMMPA